MHDISRVYPRNIGLPNFRTCNMFGDRRYRYARTRCAWRASDAGYHIRMVRSIDPFPAKRRDRVMDMSVV